MLKMAMINLKAAPGLYANAASWLHQHLKYIHTCLTLSVSTVLLTLPGYVQAGLSEWKFYSGEDYCMIKTSVRLHQGKYFTSRRAYLSIYYLDHPDITDNCIEGFTQNTFTVMVTAPSYTPFKEGSHALFQSDSLWNEQASLNRFGDKCEIKDYYALDYRLSDLLLTALDAEEDIRLTTHLKSYGEMTGLIKTEGFEKTNKRLLKCIDKLQD